MATYFARKSGNINATDVWATTPSGTAAAVTFADGDVLMANSFTVTVNVSTNLGATGQVRTDTTGGATNGGGFTLSNGVTLTANCHAGSTTCITTAGTSSATIYGNGFGGNGFQSYAFYNSGTGTLTIYGAITGGVGDTAIGAVNQQNGGTLSIYGDVIPNASASNGSGVANNGTGTVNITGNVTGRGFGGRGAINFAGGRINIYGNVTGGNNANNSFGVRNESTGTIYIEGNVTGGTNSAAFGASNASTGNITIIGLCNGSGAAVGCRNEVGGTITITGAATGGTTSTAYGLQNAGVGIVTINGSAIGGTAAHGARSESTGIIRLTRAVANAFGFGSTGLTAAVGVQNVGLGEVELEQIEYGTRGQSPTAGIIKFKSLSTNAAVFNFTNTASPKTLVDATQGDMPAVSNVRSGTTYALGTLTGTLAVPPAASVSLGVPVDNTTGTALITGSDLASAVWNAASRTITGGTVDTLTNAPASVTPSDIWSHATRTLTSASGPSAVEIRQEIDTNSAQLSAIKAKTDALPSDPADQSLLEAAIAGVAAPSASTVATAVRFELSSELGKVSALNTDRLAQCSTVATTGAQIAAALS